MNHKLLIVDDDLNLLESTRDLLNEHGYEVDCAKNGDEALSLLTGTPTGYALVVLDYHLPDISCSTLIAKLLSINPLLYVLILSGSKSAEAVSAPWKAGAVGFVSKGESVVPFLETIRKWCLKYDETTRAISPTVNLSEKEKLIHSIGLIGKSDLMSEVAKKVLKYRESDQPVMILGETGTGKELIAKALHIGTKDKFFAVNCASYNGNSELMESELFGHEAGSFTGAVKRHEGIFQAARGGTVFLDEIHHLNMTAQAKLLRVLQTKTVRPVGATREVPVSFRLVTAGKPEILELKNSGGFLPDLFRRINVLRIDIAPLRERPEDIEPLILHFSKQFEERTGKRISFLKRTLNPLISYHWPENVGELENTVTKLLTDASGKVVSPEDLDPHLFISNKEDSTYASIVAKQLTLEKEHLGRVLTAAGTQREAATRLGIPESTLRRKMKEFNLTLTNVGK